MGKIQNGTRPKATGINQRNADDDMSQSGGNRGGKLWAKILKEGPTGFPDVKSERENS